MLCLCLFFNCIPDAKFVCIWKLNGVVGVAETGSRFIPIRKWIENCLSVFRCPWAKHLCNFFHNAVSISILELSKKKHINDKYVDFWEIYWYMMCLTSDGYLINIWNNYLSVSFIVKNDKLPINLFSSSAQGLMHLPLGATTHHEVSKFMDILEKLWSGHILKRVFQIASIRHVSAGSLFVLFWLSSLPSLETFT